MHNRKTTIKVGKKKQSLNISFRQFDSVEEAIETLGKEECLELINAAHQMDQIEETENHFAAR